MSVFSFPETVIVSLSSPPYEAGSRTRLLFGAPGGIGPLSARGKGRRSFAASDAGVLAEMPLLLSPSTVISSSPEPPYDAVSRTRSLLEALGRHRSPLGARERKTLL